MCVYIYIYDMYIYIYIEREREILLSYRGAVLRVRVALIATQASRHTSVFLNWCF